MGWQRFNRNNNVFEVSDDNGQTWQTILISTAGITGVGGSGSYLAYVNITNIFTKDQYFNKASPALGIFDSSQPVNLRHFRLINVGQNLYIQSMDDAESIAYGSIRLDRLGSLIAGAGLHDYGRAVPIGSWTAYTPILNVSSGSISGGSRNGQYMLVGKTIIVQVSCDSVLITGAPTEVFVGLPAGFTTASVAGGTMRGSTPFNYYYGAGWITCMGYTIQGETYFRLNRPEGFGTPASYFWGTLIIQIG